MEAADYWVFVLLLMALTTAAFYCIWNRWHRARLIDDLPTARIRSAAQGYTELHGSAHMLEGFTTASPLSGRSCVWFRFKIERSSRDSRGRRSWRAIHTGSSDTPFVISDDTGRCLIDPRGAEVTSSRKRIWYGSTEWPNPAARPHRDTLWYRVSIGANRYRYTEELLEEGNLYALGWFRTSAGAERSLDHEVRSLLQRWKTEPQQLVARFDDNGDGQVDVQEWQAARQAAAQEALQRRVSEPHAAALHTLAAAPDKLLPFLLSDHPPARLTQRYRRQAAASVLVFIASSLALLWLLGQRA